MNSSIKSCFLYLRTSSLSQSVDSQREVIVDYCQSNDIHIRGEFVDSGVSGDSSKRPALNEMLNQITEVDCIVTYSLSRLSRQSLSSVFKTVDVITKSCELICVSDGINTMAEGNTKLMSDMIIFALGVCNNIELENIRSRCEQGRILAKAKNIKFGRKRLNIPVAEALKLMNDKDDPCSLREASRILKTTPSTLSRRIKQYKEVASL